MAIAKARKQFYKFDTQFILNIFDRKPACLPYRTFKRNF